MIALSIPLLSVMLVAGVQGAEQDPEPAEELPELVVTTAEDAGAGSLRKTIIEAESRPGPDSILFDREIFSEPQFIALESPLPEITSEITIDGYIPDRLWKSNGVTVSGSGQFPVFRVGAGALVTLRYLTVADGCGQDGGGIVNLGKLVVYGVTFLDNQAEREGGAIANLGGDVTVINSTFAGNQALGSGGAFASTSGRATITNCTFSENSAGTGGAVYNDDQLLLRNTILANSPIGGDCASEGILDPASTRNLIEDNRGCGTPISTEDPNLEPLGYYNGPAKTFPVGAGSPAVNLGDNEAALDENGDLLVWDQRGSGDPRFVAGFTDLGAFEHQRHPYLSVDTLEDTRLRACTRAGAADCPLRGAIEIANTRPERDIITFDPRVFAEPQTLLLTRPLPEVTSPLTLDAAGTGGVRLAADGGFTVLTVSPGTAFELVDVITEEGDKTLAEP
jgi:predicted outer membrane repeat protein